MCGGPDGSFPLVLLRLSLGLALLLEGEEALLDVPLLIQHRLQVVLTDEAYVGHTGLSEAGECVEQRLLGGGVLSVLRQMMSMRSAVVACASPCAAWNFMVSMKDCISSDDSPCPPPYWSSHSGSAHR